MDYIINEKIREITGRRSNMLPCSFSITLFRKRGGTEILSKGLDPKRYQKSKNKTLLLIGHLIMRRKGILMRAALSRILGKTNRRELHINLRSWPDKYTIDLDNIDICPTSQLTKDSKKLPFCYALVMNERDSNL
jgi:hypothetical protein